MVESNLDAYIEFNYRFNNENQVFRQNLAIRSQLLSPQNDANYENHV